MGIQDRMARLLGERTKFLHGGESEAEGEMAKLQLRRIVSMAQMLDGLLIDDDQLPGWVQSHISDAANNLTQVLGYMEPKSKE